jgi:hypothetical protein
VSLRAWLAEEDEKAFTRKTLVFVSYAIPAALWRAAKPSAAILNISQIIRENFAFFQNAS